MARMSSEAEPAASARSSFSCSRSRRPSARARLRRDSSYKDEAAAIKRPSLSHSVRVASELVISRQAETRELDSCITSCASCSKVILPSEGACRATGSGETRSVELGSFESGTGYHQLGAVPDASTPAGGSAG